MYVRTFVFCLLFSLYYDWSTTLLTENTQTVSYINSYIYTHNYIQACMHIATYYITIIMCSYCTYVYAHIHK